MFCNVNGGIVLLKNKDISCNVYDTLPNLFSYSIKISRKPIHMVLNECDVNLFCSNTHQSDSLRFDDTLLFDFSFRIMTIIQ